MRMKRRGMRSRRRRRRRRMIKIVYRIAEPGYVRTRALDQTALPRKKKKRGKGYRKGRGREGVGARIRLYED